MSEYTSDCHIPTLISSGQHSTHFSSLPKNILTSAKKVPVRDHARARNWDGEEAGNNIWHQYLSDLMTGHATSHGWWESWGCEAPWNTRDTFYNVPRIKIGSLGYYRHVLRTRFDDYTILSDKISLFQETSLPDYSRYLPRAYEDWPDQWESRLIVIWPIRSLATWLPRNCCRRS